MALEKMVIEAQPEVLKSNPKDEIVALMAVPKARRDGDELKDVDGYKMHICKSGEADFYLRKGQFVRIKLGVAEWHVAKARGNDHTNPLELKILTLDEIQKILSDQKTGKAAQPKEKTDREILIDQLLKAKVIESAKEAEGLSDAELKAHLPDSKG